MRCLPTSTAARDLRWPRLRELADRPPNRVDLRRCSKGVPRERDRTFPPVHHTGPARAGCGERRDRTVRRGAIVFSPPRRCYAGIEAGGKIGSKTGYEYLAPSLTTHELVSPNTQPHASVFRRDGWDLRLITSACNCQKRYQPNGILAGCVRCARDRPGSTPSNDIGLDKAVQWIHINCPPFLATLFQP
jgi:hypothetical protein